MGHAISDPPPHSIQHHVLFLSLAPYVEEDPEEKVQRGLFPTIVPDDRNLTGEWALVGGVETHVAFYLVLHCQHLCGGGDHWNDLVVSEGEADWV